MKNKMSNYIKQQDDYSCGAISIMNALIWVGKKMSTKNDFDRIVNNCGIIRKYGATNQSLFETSLKKETKGLVKIKKRYGPRFSLIKNHFLDKNNSMIMKFLYEEKGKLEGHFTFIDDYTNGYFSCINFTDTGGVSLIKEGEIKKSLDFFLRNDSRDKIYHYPYVWLLSKEIKNVD